MRFTGMGGIRGLAGIGMGNMFLCMGGLGGGGGLGRWSRDRYWLLARGFLFVVCGLCVYGFLLFSVPMQGVYLCRGGAGVFVELCLFVLLYEDLLTTAP